MKARRVNRNVAFTVSLLGLLLSAASIPTAEAAELYQKKATWAETMLALKAKLHEKVEEPTPIEFGPWFTTGSLPAKDFGEALFPEKAVDLKAKGPDGKPRWEEKAGWQDGHVHDLPSGGSRGATYLFRTIQVKEATRLPAGFGSDDGLAVWLGGKQLLSNNASRGAGANQDRAALELVPGENRLLVKIFNNGGGHGFYFSANPADEVDPLPEIWKQIEKDFPVEAGWMRRHLGGQCLAWFDEVESVDLETQMIEKALRDLGRDGPALRGRLDTLVTSEAAPDDPRWLQTYTTICLFRHRPAELRQVNVAALRLAVEDLIETYGGRYRKGREYLKQIDDYERRVGQLELALARGDSGAAKQVPGLVKGFERLRQEALLANPLLDIDRLLVVRRKADRLGLPQNWQGNCAIAKNGYDNEMAVLSPVRPDGKLRTLFRPEKGRFVGDVDLHFDADRMLFSMPGENGRWQIFEIKADGSGLRQVTTGEEPDVDNYDACYLPDGRIIFDSTRCFHGVPCVGGGNTVANLCLMNADGSGIRQLCFDQDHDWCPTVLNNGRVLFARWEYSDAPHYFTRLLFHMNPDGTGQMEYYASNSPWPNSIFYARPIPDHPTKVIAVISGHHGVPRMGELLLFDPAKGRRRADGAVQRIPGYGQKVEPIIRDALVNGSWPKFLHPYPLSDKHFLVSMQRDQNALWGIYLVDVFDNMVLLKEEPGYALFEPVPFRKTPRPPVIPDRVKPERRDATVYLSNVYFGRGLEGVPRGTVRRLRIYEPHYAYPHMGGHIHVGIDGPWDVHRILGTVPVEKDGSASFKVPANTPLAVQPLDSKGRAVQIMRSWFVAMPGETLSCVGCHESQNTSPPARQTLATQRKPSQITPWYGPVRGFSFKREIQPVLDRNCVGCHDGKQADRPDFAAKEKNGWGNFTPSYIALHPYVRRPGPESDYFMQRPLEYHATTSELVQMLEKGHHNVKLDDEAWDRLTTWIDLNVPDHGTWSEHRKIAGNLHQRRLEMRTKYANRPEDPEEYPTPPPGPVAFVKPQPEPERKPQKLNVPGWPFDAAEAKERQEAAGVPAELKIELAEGLTLELVLVPAGQFVMGTADGAPDEYPQARVNVEKAFYVGKFEVTNAQYALFDPGHDSAYISVFNKDQSTRGEVANRQRQPVIRITWQQAARFCEWLSKKTGHRFTLPTEAQWEYACRAGTTTPMSYGDVNADFGKHANLADQRVNNLCRRDSPRWIPAISSVNDGAVVTDHVGRYPPNAFGLCDVHGNVAEWTRTAYRPYPYDARDGRDHPRAGGTKVARGGSFYDRPQRATSSFRQQYQPWQRVFCVGFRVVMEP